MSRPRLLVAAGLLILLPILGFLFRIALLTGIGAFLIVNGRLRPADALIALGGGRGDREVYAASLYAAGYAPVVVVTGADAYLPGLRVTWAELERQELLAHGVPDSAIILLDQSTTTDTDAKLAIALSQERGWRSLLVVTDPFHTRRAAIRFDRYAQPAGIEATVVPAPSWWSVDTWWQDGHAAEALLHEYLGLLAYGVGDLIGISDDQR